MTDLDRSQVEEALQIGDCTCHHDKLAIAWHFDCPYVTVGAAAREWLALTDAIEKAPKVWWCDFHRVEDERFPRATSCYAAQTYAEYARCVMVEEILLPVEGP